ncbi:proton-coupled amino acid transporter-like protein CG1139 [Planococcus citri]|uniref:proton-coupled amino acid transporter-like protein CG1139 n=1 Tax=Planococcus citri TaxID=170843 RepID=UPI0031F8620A
MAENENTSKNCTMNSLSTSTHSSNNSNASEEITLHIKDDGGNGEHPQASISTTIFHMLALSIGPTVFIIPSAFNMVGYIPATIGIILISLFYFYNVQILLDSSTILCRKNKKDTITYAEIVRYAFQYGPPRIRSLTVYTYTLMNILFVVSWAGELSFSVVFVCKNIKFISDWYLESDTDLRIIVIILILPCTLITLSSNLKLTILSLLATIIDVLFIAYVIWTSCTDHRLKNVNFRALNAVYNIPDFLAIIFFTLNFTGIALPLKYDMKNPEKFDSKFGAFNAAMIIITAINIVFGFFGYTTYGSKIKDTMTLNLPHGPVTHAMIVVYCIAILLTYPVCYFVIFNIVWNEWVKNKIRMNVITTRIVINLVLFSVIIILPKLSLFTEICGLVCAVFDSVMIPSVVHILMSWENEKKFRIILIKSTLIFAFGILLFICGMYQSLNDIVEGDQGS